MKKLVPAHPVPAGTVRAKIVATLGPASREAVTVDRILAAGADVIRLNFSHGTHDSHREAVQTVRAAGARVGRCPGFLADLQGPKIRVGRTEGDRPVTVREGTVVALTGRACLCTEDTLCVDYPGLVPHLRAGQDVLVNDGALHLRVRSVNARGDHAEAVALNTGVYSSRKGLNLPNARLPIRAFTPKDRRDLALALELDLPIVAMSFVRGPADLRPVRAAIRRAGKRVALIAKIETPEAVEGIEAILDDCDGIMVARGDLGVELPPDVLPVVQKDLIRAANRKGRMVIVATQMLESMTGSPRPTRAEATDVANAVLDGTDAVMLSAETSAGQYPVEAVAMMRRIVAHAEQSAYYGAAFRDLALPDRRMEHAMCEAAAWASRDLDAAPVVLLGAPPEAAVYLSKVRCAGPVFAFTVDPVEAGMLALAWNVRPVLLPARARPGGAEDFALRALARSFQVARGAPVLVLAGGGARRNANALRLHLRKID